MVETARDLGHDYLVITDHSPRLTVANGLSAQRLRAQLEQVAELNAELPDRLPGAHRHRGRHPRRRRARPGRGAARRARCRGGLGALQAADAPGGDDRADADGRREPARRRAGPLHGPDGDREAEASRVGVRRRRGVRRVRRVRRGGGGELAPGASRPAASGCCGRRSRPAARSRSTPTRTRPASSTGCATAASARSPARCRPTGSATPGRSSACSPVPGPDPARTQTPPGGPRPAAATVRAWLVSRPVRALRIADARRSFVSAGATRRHHPSRSRGTRQGVSTRAGHDLPLECVQRWGTADSWAAGGEWIWGRHPPSTTSPGPAATGSSAVGGSAPRREQVIAAASAASSSSASRVAVSIAAQRRPRGRAEQPPPVQPGEQRGGERVARTDRVDHGRPARRGAATAGRAPCRPARRRRRG